MWVHHEMGRCYLELGAFDKSRENGEKAMNLASEAKDMTWYLNASVLVALSEGTDRYCTSFISCTFYRHCPHTDIMYTCIYAPYMDI